MILFLDPEAEAEGVKLIFDEIKDQGFKWYTPMFLDSDDCFEGTDIPQVEDHCPNCRFITDRHFNCTDRIDGWVWSLKQCCSCNALWFEKDY